MRITKVLFQMNYKRTFEQIWKGKSKRKYVNPLYSGMWDLKGIEHLDVLKAIYPPPPEKIKDTKVKTTGIFPGNLKKTVIPKNAYRPEKKVPQYKDEPLYVYHNDINLAEGEKQLLVLTKTVMLESLPQSLQNISDSLDLEEYDEKLKRILLESHVLNGARDLLPVKHVPDMEHYNFTREYGITYDAKINNLKNKLISLANLIAVKMDMDGFLQRKSIVFPHNRTYIKREEDLVAFDLRAEGAVIANKPLPNHAGPAEVAETSKASLVDIFPLKPLATFEVCKDYELFNIDMFNGEKDDTFPHTLFSSYKYIKDIYPEHKICTAIGHCFISAKNHAQKLYGENVKELPEPITVQCIYTDVTSMRFVTYQLNTLDLEVSTGIKNQAWVDGPHEMFTEISDDGIEGFDPTFFNRFLTFYLNGLKMESLFKEEKEEKSCSQ